MGDFNAKIGKGEVGRIVGKFGLGARYELGDRSTSTVLPGEKLNYNK